MAAVGQINSVNFQTKKERKKKILQRSLLLWRCALDTEAHLNQLESFLFFFFCQFVLPLLEVVHLWWLVLCVHPILPPNDQKSQAEFTELIYLLHGWNEELNFTSTVYWQFNLWSQKKTPSCPSPPTKCSKVQTRSNVFATVKQKSSTLSQ